MKKLPVFLALVTLLSSCASVLNSKYQKITINKDPRSEILVNGEKPGMKDGKYLLQRDGKPKQITAQLEGFKEETLTVMQYAKSPLYALSWVPFGILILPPFYDMGPKSFDYAKEISFSKKLTQKPVRDAGAKEIKFNKVSVDLGKEQMRYRYFASYRRYLHKQSKLQSQPVEGQEKIEVENTIFSDKLNRILIDGGFIDTTRVTLKDNFLNNMLLNATIVDFTINYVRNSHLPYEQSGMVYADVEIKWDVLDYYQKEVYSLNTKSESGQFIIDLYHPDKKSVREAVGDAVEFGFVHFMETERVQKLLHDRSIEQDENAFTALYLPENPTHVSNLQEAVQSSVTVLDERGHGSGFVISPEGHIITNYHVVSGGKPMTVRMNDGEEYPAEVIRVSKIHDLALLKIKASGLLPFRLKDDHNIAVATDIYAIGTPSSQDLSQTISRGIISGIRRGEGGKNLIQTDASVNPGNSGGAIVDKNGLVLGVVSSKLEGYSIEGVAFGIPAYEIMEKMKINFGSASMSSRKSE